MVLTENSSIGISPESTYGTFSETGQVHLLCESYTTKTDVTLAERADNTGSIFGLSSVPTRKVRTTSCTSKLYPGNEIGYLLQNTFGAPATTGAGPYVHIFSLEEANLLTKFTSFEVVTGGLIADDLDGGVITGWTISGANEGFVKIEYNVVHQGRTAGTVAASYVHSAVLPYTYCMALVNFDSSEIKVDSWSIAVDLAIRGDNFKNGSANCEIDKPVLNGTPTVTATFEIDMADFSYRTLYEAGTSVQPFYVLITHTAIAGGATPYSLKLELPATQVTENEAPPTGGGQVKETVTLMGLVGTSSGGSNTTNFEATLTNATASYA